MTVNVAWVVCVRLPLIPVMVSVKVPLGPVADGVTLRVELVVAGLGVNETLAPEGWPLRLRVTDPLKPLDGLIATV